MKKTVKTILILAVILIIVIVADVIVNNVVKNNNKKRENESEAESIANTIQVGNLGEINSISFNNGVENLTFEKKDGTWTYPADDKFPLDTSFLQLLENDFSNLTALKKITDGESIENYGLDNPKYEVTLKDNAGASESLQIGNLYDGSYYTLVNNDIGTIYICGFKGAVYLGYDLLQFAKIDDISSCWKDNIIGIDIIKDENETYIKKKNETEDSWTVSIDGEKAYDVTDTSEINELENTLDFKFKGCIMYNVDEEKYADYGLDKPLYKVTVEYYDSDKNAKSITFIIGGYDSESDTYSSISTNSKEIYALSSDTVKALDKVGSYDFKADNSEE